jgi:hypothetical protein
MTTLQETADTSQRLYKSRDWWYRTPFVTPIELDIWAHFVYDGYNWYGISVYQVEFAKKRYAGILGWDYGYDNHFKTVVSDYLFPDYMRFTYRQAYDEDTMYTRRMGTYIGYGYSHPVVHPRIYRKIGYENRRKDRLTVSEALDIANGRYYRLQHDGAEGPDIDLNKDKRRISSTNYEIDYDFFRFK